MKSDLSALFFLPSFYALVTWTVALLLYHMRLMDWFDAAPMAIMIFWGTTLIFLIATILSWPAAKQVVERLHQAQTQARSLRCHVLSAIPLWMPIIFHLIGFIGLGLYLAEIVGTFGGLEPLIGILLAESYLIRQSEIELLSIYISYFGWIAIPLSILWMYSAQKWSYLLILLTLSQFAGNLLFLDRTRPVWLVFVSVIILLPLLAKIDFKSILIRLSLIIGAGLTAFFAIGIWLGKTGEAFSHYGYVSIDNHSAALYYYLTGGFAYMAAQIEMGPPSQFSLAQSLYPLFKAGSMLGLNDPPPSQILPFVELPFPANVGTFLEPYFMDGGYGLMLIALVVHSFVLNLAALYFLRTCNPWGWYLWATLCFVGFISFFVPKLVSTPVWLFFSVAMPIMMLKGMRTGRAVNSQTNHLKHMAVSRRP